MIKLYRILSCLVVIVYMLATARGYPVLNMFSSSTGAQKGARIFHK